ncbi:MAG: hypothetical protein FWG34_05525 [Oscillospiraceae bacterium]|nr:hypothetical protein [Oscillospiraceae bacterium]
MKRNAIALKLAAVALCLSLISGIASSAASNQSAIEKCIGAFEAAEPIFAELQEFVRTEIEGFDDDDGEYDEEEAEAMIVKLREYADQLEKSISGLNGFSRDMDTGEGKTVAAVREYLAMLKNICGDMSEVIAYSIEFTDALKPMSEDDKEFESYGDFANNLYLITSESLELLREIKPPSYLAITHGDVIARIAEFRDFAADFQWATYLDDPLRIFSCEYRMDRIVVMFDKCAENINSDLLLQLKQAKRRLDESISTLHSELSAYFALLKSQ